LLSLHTLRSSLRKAQTEWSKLAAAPDRRRRRRRAEQLRGTETPLAAGCADAPGDLAAQGFSRCRPDRALLDRLLEDWKGLKAHANRAAARAQPRSTGKAFFEEMLSLSDLRAYPAFLETALDETVIASVMQAMGMVPHLESVDVLASRSVGTQLSASQLWHYDVNDVRIIKLFVYLEDCGPRNGPFTFIPAEPSQRVAGVAGHYVDDEAISLHVPRSEWRSVEGPAGTAFLIDTGRCYHFGSRSELTRVAYVATYSSGLKFMSRSRAWADVLGERADRLSPLQRAVCALEA
jgi:hypothetical protein